MSGRIFVLLLLLAVLTTAGTFLYTTESKKVLRDPGLADLERYTTLHGWPWGYYGRVREMVRMGEHRVAVMEYTEVHAEHLFQTLALWFLVWLLVVPLVLLGSGSRRP